MSTVAGHDLYDLHLVSGYPINARSSRVVVEVELGGEVFADVQDPLGINCGPKPPVRFHPGVQDGSGECGLD